MKKSLSLTALCLGLMAAPALAQDCPWAGGEYEFKEHGVYGDFTVNADCTELTWTRLSDSPETSALTRTKNGWEGELSKADFELLDSGKFLRITGTGGAMRQVSAKRKN
ncbi:hypothetical protein AVO45_07365 [Ruegeria marisrubri]|uniref:Uncharacterized protein n=1 Tax=Ruegeria marisrubri TaxID=1685379 RepID=A0A0X3TYU6_9RHOB|nr:hypothetical protein [Ruegeria marisrubri]KUJ80839.1 hypothetical protein AVO45_07365 [Ruegeria marisrubri]